MLSTILGLPIHPLIVHATVVIVPAAAVAVLLTVFWPRFRGWIGWGLVAFPLLALVLVPLTTQSGEALEHLLPRNRLIEQHVHLADGLLPWVIALAAGSIGLYLQRPGVPRITGGREFPRWLVVVITVVSVAAALGTIVETIVIGHTGATAAWSGVG
jgi:hypothetical protein